LNLPDISVRLAQPSDRGQLAILRNALWPEASIDEHSAELKLLLAGTAPVPMPLAILVAEASGGALAGFLEIDLRSHADGCNPSRPVGYVEGWFIAKDYRRQGLGAKLMAAADKKAIFLHCLPAHRGEEVSADVIDGAQSRVWDEAENRLHVQKAIMAALMGEETLGR